MTVPEMITFASEYFDDFNSLNYYTSRNIAPDGAVDGYEKTWYNEFINVSLMCAPLSSQSFFQYGNYGTVIGIYRQKFPNIHLVDGALHIKSDSEFKQLIDYFDLDSSRLKFEFNPEKGFLCLHEPVRFCLDNLKGNTRKESTLKDKIEKYPELARWIEGYRGEFTTGDDFWRQKTYG